MYIIADIGGTKTRVAVARDTEKFEEPLIFDSSQDDTEFINRISEAFDSVANGEPVEKVVVGKPHWKRRPTIADEIQRISPAPVHFENDTALVGLGEAVFGAGRGTDIFVYVTISTGVNGVRIVKEVIDPSIQGFEIGGQYITADTNLSWEEMISGKAVAKRFGMSPKELGKEHEIWEELARNTAQGLHNTILHWSPEKVAIGGSMMNEIGIPIDSVRKYIQEMMRKFHVETEIVRSELGDLGGLYGGLALLKQKA